MKYPPLNQYCSFEKSFFSSLSFVTRQVISMVETLESKLEAIISALVALLHRQAEKEGVLGGLHNDRASRMMQSKLHPFQPIALEEAAMPLL